MEGETNTICYHGTNLKAALKILKGGFRVNTWFSPYLNVSLDQGGPFVFYVYFENKTPDNWQWFTREHIPASNIISLKLHFSFKLFFSRSASSRHRRGWLSDYHKAPACDHCDGHGQMNPRVNFFRHPKKVIPCPVCKGYGVIFPQEGE